MHFLLLLGACAHDRTPAASRRPAPSTEPLLSVLEAPPQREGAPARIFLSTHKKGLASLLFRRARERGNPLVLEQLERSRSAKKVVQVFTEAVAEEASSERPKFKCFMGDEQWDNILHELEDLSRYERAQMKTRIRMGWQMGVCEAGAASSSTNGGLPPLSELVSTSTGRNIDTLAYVETSISREATIVRTSMGELKVLGTLIALNYEDQRQSDGEENFATLNREWGSDILISLTRGANTFGVGAYAYTYGVPRAIDRESEGMVPGQEIYISFQRKLSDYLSVTARYVWGTSAGESYNQIRIFGSYVPRIWR